MDCGPAALTCLLHGYNIPASYDHLRDATQTDVDGTSIDTLEQVARSFGLEVEQTMLPEEHLAIPAARALPAIVVVTQPGGLTHFVVLWRSHGRRVQVMDPATGRRWPAWSSFCDELYRHELAIPAVQWRAWAGGPEFGGALLWRMRQLGLPARLCRGHIETALTDPTHATIARLDAGVRMLRALRQTKALRTGAEVRRWLMRDLEQAPSDPTGEQIPEPFWSVRPSADEPGKLLLRGAVLVRVLGAPAAEAARAAGAAGRTPTSAVKRGPSLSRPAGVPLVRPLAAAWRMIGAGERHTLIMLAAIIAFSAAGIMVEALLFRGLFDIGPQLELPWQRLAAMAALAALSVALLLLDGSAAAACLRLGRKLEGGLRLALFRKLPRLADPYFRSRLMSDLAERSHSIHELRWLPQLSAQAFRAAAEVVFTTAGIVWLAPGAAWPACLAALVAIGLPLAAQRVLSERDLRVRTHLGALGRFYVDGMMGLSPIRTHVAERSLRREHETLLAEWAGAGLRMQGAAVAVEALQLLLGFGLAGGLLWRHLSATRQIGGALLLAYWSLHLPVLGQQIGHSLRQMPALRSVMRRIQELLDGPEEDETHRSEPPATAAAAGTGQGAAKSASGGAAGRTDEKADTSLTQADGFLEVARTSANGRPNGGPHGVRLQLDDVTLVTGGQTILEHIHLTIEPGEQVAVVGSSGAGKSSLAGLLLGWHRPTSGSLTVDGAVLDAAALQRLRRETAWVDPTVHLWNDSLLTNLTYGHDDTPPQLTDVLVRAELVTVVQALPHGLQSSLGEGGGVLSGGEGQRVRCGRALLHSGARLVILDEPFRGLDRECRLRLLAQFRSRWPRATLLCITHDVSDTRQFSRVVVMESGRVIEDDDPQVLAGRTGGRYHTLLAAEDNVGAALWNHPQWRRWRLAGGALQECSREERP